MLNIDFDNEEGVITFTPNSPWDRTMIEIDGVCKSDTFDSFASNSFIT